MRRGFESLYPCHINLIDFAYLKYELVLIQMLLWMLLRGEGRSERQDLFFERIKIIN